MPKNILLPREYDTPAIQAAILCALKEYDQCGNIFVDNPQVKWDLHKAWRQAEALLTSSRWKHRGHIAFGADFSEYELSAETEGEIREANTIIAGIVAYQIMYPELRVVIRDIIHRKGGAISIVISAWVAETLQEMVPTMMLAGRRRQAVAVKEETFPALPPVPENIALHG